MNELKAIHQRLEFERKYLDIILRKENDLAQITAKVRPKRPNKRARKALKNAASNQSEILPPKRLVVVTVSSLHCQVEVATTFFQSFGLCPDMTVRLTFKTISLLPSLRVMRYSRLVPPSQFLSAYC